MRDNTCSLKTMNTYLKQVVNQKLTQALVHASKNILTPGGHPPQLWVNIAGKMNTVSLENTSIINREDNYLRRKVKEAIEIQRQAPILNRDRGYELPAIYKDILSDDSAHHGSSDKCQ